MEGSGLSVEDFVVGVPGVNMVPSAVRQWGDRLADVAT